VDRGLIVVPNTCTKCGKKATMRMIPNRSGFLNRQVRCCGYCSYYAV
jgi:hypothetical protein